MVRTMPALKGGAQPAHAVDAHFRHGPCLVPRLKRHRRSVTAWRPRGKDRAEPACGRTWPPLTRKPLAGPRAAVPIPNEIQGQLCPSNMYYHRICRSVLNVERSVGD